MKALVASMQTLPGGANNRVSVKQCSSVIAHFPGERALAAVPIYAQISTVFVKLGIYFFNFCRKKDFTSLVLMSKM